MTTLQDRSFRKFEPSLDATRRKGVILDFSGPISVWAQYAIGDYAVEEWEIVAHEFSIERTSDFFSGYHPPGRRRIEANYPKRVPELHSLDKRINPGKGHFRQR